MRVHVGNPLVPVMVAGNVALTDIGTASMLGGLLGEVLVRLGPLFGWEPAVEGWREGMFFGALTFFLVWLFGATEV